MEEDFFDENVIDYNELLDGGKENLQNFIEIYGKKGITSLSSKTLDAEFLSEQRLQLNSLFFPAEGTTFLMLLIQKKFEDMAALIIKHECDNLAAQDTTGNTALIWACIKNCPDIVTLLLGKKNININAQGHNGSTALIWACYRNYPKIVALLLGKENIDINAQDHEKTTALMYACFQNRADIIKLLLINGACTHIAYDGGLAIDCIKNDDDLKELLRQVTDYKKTVTAHAEQKKYNDALYNAIQKSGKSKQAVNKKLTKYEWLHLAFINKNEEQIQYCIDQNILIPDDFKGLKCYLKTVQHKKPKELLTMCQTGETCAHDILCAFMSCSDSTYLQDVLKFLEYTTKEQRIMLLKMAQDRNNKKLGKEIIEFNKNIVYMKGKHLDKNIYLPLEIANKIASYLHYETKDE